MRVRRFATASTVPSAVALAVLITGHALAAPITYTAPNDNNWSVNGNWSGNAEPTFADDVTISGSNFVVNMSPGEEAGNLTLLGSSNLVGGSLTVAGTLSRLGQGQSELRDAVVIANRVAIDNTGSQGNSASLMVRNATASLTIGPGGLSMVGLIDGATQRTARLTFRGSAAAAATLQGNVDVQGHAQFGNASAFTSLVKLEGMRTFTVNPVTGGTGLNVTGSLTIAARTDVFEGSNSGEVALADGAVPGGVTKAGASSMIINTPSSYSLGTLVTAGILQASVPGSLGSGDVSVTGGQLTLGTGLAITGAGFIADTADLTVSGTGLIALNFTGSDTIHTLTIGTLGLEADTYSATTHPTLFSGPGTLVVTTSIVVPEPAAASILLLTAPLLRRKRR